MWLVEVDEEAAAGAGESVRPAALCLDSDKGGSEASDLSRSRLLAMRCVGVMVDVTGNALSTDMARRGRRRLSHRP